MNADVSALLSIQLPREEPTAELNVKSKGEISACNNLRVLRDYYIRFKRQAGASDSLS